MEIQKYIDRGFTRYAEMRSDSGGKYKRGICINKLQADMNVPGIYILCSCVDGSIHKIGESQDLEGRMRMYLSVINTTNNRVRGQAIIEGLDVYIYPTPYIRQLVLGHMCISTCTKDLERFLLKEYRTENGRLPSLNAYIR